MIELRTLGALELKDSHGQPILAILQQPKRLGLLAYLGVASPRRFHRRDTLLAMFWPELDDKHARAALRRALYFLRRSLGEGVVVGRGDEEVGIADGSLWTDTEAFRQALDQRRQAEALELYQGDLLQGFFISGVPEFERWLDTERAHLHRRASDAALALIGEQQAAGELRAATHWARRAFMLSPDDEAALRRVLELLDRTGDRAGALRTYDDFARRLAQEYDLEPAAETRSLIETIRARSAVTSLPPALQPLEVSPHVIAVFPFSVRGASEFAYLSEGMVDLLSTKLDGAGPYRTVDPRALLSAVAGGGADEVDPTRGVSLARRFGAGLFLLGSVVAAGGRLQLSASLYSLDARLKNSVNVAGTREAEIFDLVDELARQLLAGESQAPSERVQRLAALTTDSIAALKAYLRGEHLFRLGRHFEAIEAFQEAATQDPSFALAYYRQAASAAAIALVDMARGAADRAHDLRSRLSEHDRLLLEAQRAWLNGSANEAESIYTTLLDRYPDDLEAWFLLGDLQFHANPLRGRSATEARGAFERALGFEPAHVGAVVHLARIAAIEGRKHELGALIDRVLELSPEGDQALAMRALRAFALGGSSEQEQVAAELQHARALSIGVAFSDIALYSKDLRGAQHVARLFSTVARDSTLRALCHLMLAHLEVASGRWSSAKAELRLAQECDVAWALEIGGLFTALPFLPVSQTDLERTRGILIAWDAGAVPASTHLVLAAHNHLHRHLRLYLLGLVSARLGDIEEALSFAKQLAQLEPPPEHGAFVGHLSQSIVATAAWNRKDFAAALRALDHHPAEIWFQLTVVSPFFSQAYERYLRAETLRELGRGEQALGWYVSIAERSPYELVYAAPAHLRAGQILGQMGRAEDAKKHYARFEQLWKECDPELRQALGR